jgi:hypothetical protein
MQSRLWSVVGDAWWQGCCLVVVGRDTTQLDYAAITAGCCWGRPHLVKEAPAAAPSRGSERSAENTWRSEDISGGQWKYLEVSRRGLLE